MPVLKYPTKDMFDLAPYVDFMVNPVNLLGAMDYGIAAEFLQRHPALREKFMAKVDAGKLGIGQIQIITDPTVNYKIINLVTKNHFADETKKSVIIEGLGSIRRYLKKPENRFATLVIPILATPGPNGYDEMAQEFVDMFDDLDAIVCLCMHPDKIGYTPKVLVAVGPPDWAVLEKVGSSGYTREIYDSQYSFVEDGIKEALSFWELKKEDFETILSGGDPGVMTAVCGRVRGDEYEPECVAVKLGFPNKTVAHADVTKKGKVAARSSRDRILLHLATHVVVILPPKSPAVDAYKFIKATRANNLEHPIGTLKHKFLFVKGEEEFQRARIIM